MTQKIVILGAGLAGFGAAHHLYKNKKKSTIYEKNSYYGGHAATFIDEGFTFDDGPHISFTKHDRLRKLFDESVQQKVESFSSNVNNYWKGYWIKHPAPVNLFGLPKPLIVKIINEFFEAQTSNLKSINNYKEWLYMTYGKTFSETFPMQYTKKFHTTSAENLDTDWIGPRLYKPNMEEVLNGALSTKTENVHYVNDFFYPTHGGFARFLNQFVNQTDLKLLHEAKKIDPKKKIISFTSGKKECYDYLISSLPLPELISIIEGVPDEIIAASQKLSCSSCVCVNIGVDRNNLSEANWTYFYDDDIIFTRLSFPHTFSPNNTPKNCGSIQAEIYFSKKYKPLTKSPEDFIEPTISDLIRCKIINTADKIIFKNARFSPYANVIFDLDRVSNLSIVHKYLDMIGIKYCGRYGDWNYSWTDEAFISGENAAKKVIQEIAIYKVKYP